MVDSFGGVFPADVINTIDLVREYSDVPLGFHGHNNLEMALANTIAALENGVNIVDATITGMGRGAGNLKTELLLTYLNQKNSLDVDFNALSSTVDQFTQLQEQYQWGTNLPYMVSGANSLPQKDVMEWVSKRFYPLDSIVQALTNKKNSLEDNKRFPIFQVQTQAKQCIVIGGGPSAKNVALYVKALVEKDNTICLIHSSSRNAGYFKEISCEQYFCLVGNEGNRLAASYGDLRAFNGKCVLPPYPRKMGSVVPTEVEAQCFELAQISFSDVIKDAHTSLALQLAIDLGMSEVMMIGYDEDSYDQEQQAEEEEEPGMTEEEIFK
jgi:4-hydroxy 2-oxovalerate aldolase